MTGQAPANWYPDPFGRHELRYWDGGQWTQHVASRGRQEIDPPVGGSPVPTVNRAGKKVQREVRMAGVAAGAQVGGGTLFTEPVLVVNQKAKLIEVNAEYAVYDQHGQQIGAVREVGQSFMKKAMAVPADGRTHRLQVVDLNGRVLIALTRPAKIFRSKVIVRDANGAEIGQIVQKNIGVFGKIRFVLESGGQPLGSINGEGWDAWDFNVQDATGNEIARITKTWAGLAKEMFTKGDNYVVQIHRSLDEPLRSLVIAAALAVDTALKQGSN
jgi:rRNA processing protein Gar1